MNITFKRLLHQLYTAPNNFNTLDMRWQTVHHKARWHVLRQRWLDASPSGSRSMSSIEDMPDIWRNHHALWWQRGERWRMDDASSGHYNRELNIQGDQWRFSRTIDTSALVNLATISLDMPDIYVRRREPASYAVNRPPSALDAAPVDPTVVLAIYDLTPVEETTYLGRQAVVVDAAYRRNWRCSRPSDAVGWVHADRCRLLVDAERGFLLRHAALLDGEEAVVTEVTALRVDAPLDDATFALPPAAESA